ncbi:Zinc finger CW-type PWWP domain protein 2 [Cricetulus griseus]|uniref:Zinc finger CW-type PWWP domain protein 2 n=1 Tax=Cricetulus griseus TaxID=10029 RepID=G3GV95_CRIGR|nr:Zinc finger CW-type PWWP domain protein 2 [Cricetulus griseus]
MNADSSHNSCSVSEEAFPAESQFLESGYKIVYSQLPLGSLVLVELQNWPSWPGILCPDPFKGKYVTYDQDGNVEKYHIEFLGDPHSRAWINAKFVGHYSLSLKVAECTSKKRWYRSALEEADQLSRNSPEQRLEVCYLSNRGMCSFFFTIQSEFLDVYFLKYVCIFKICVFSSYTNVVIWFLFIVKRIFK